MGRTTLGELLYTIRMHNWDYDLATIRQNDDAERWKLERLILYGLGGEKISRQQLKKHRHSIAIPEDRLYFLNLLLE